MLSLEKIKELGFVELKASNGNPYYQKGVNILIPYNTGWQLKFKSLHSTSYTYLESEKELNKLTNLMSEFIIPLKEDNIYPYTAENVEALLNHYFNFKRGDVKWVFELKELSLNQLEFTMKKVVEYQYLLDTYFNNKSGKTVSNYLRYAIDACFDLKDNKKGSGTRQKITSELRDLIMNN